jgi:hypothetical protein
MKSLPSTWSFEPAESETTVTVETWAAVVPGAVASTAAVAVVAQNLDPGRGKLNLILLTGTS